MRIVTKIKDQEEREKNIPEELFFESKAEVGLF